MASQALPSYLTASSFTSVVDGTTQTGIATVVVTSVLPTQELPSYLSASPFTTTVDGVEITGTSIVRVPLTYIGPSVSSLDPGTPIGSQGSTTPASLTSTSTATPSPSSTETSSITTSTASSSVPTSNGSEPSASPTTSSTEPESTPTAGAGAVSGSGLTTGQLIGVIIAASIVALVISLLIILCYYRHRRRRAGYTHPNISEFVIVDSEGQVRLAGEGSPRPTGEEEDSFLRGSRSGETTNEMREISPTARLVQNPSPTATERTTGTTVPPEGVVPTALKTPPDSPSHSSGPKLPSPFFHASSSSLFFNPSRGPDQSLVGAAVGAAKRDSASTRGSSASTGPPSPANGNAGRIISPQQLMQMDNDWRGDFNGGRGGAAALRRGPSELGERAGSPLRPPNVYDTSSSMQGSSMRTMGSHPDAAVSDGDERTTLLMAHRFNMSEGGPAVMVQSDDETSSPSSWRSSLAFGLQGLRLSRLSWFQRMNENRAHSPSSAMPIPRSGTPSQLPTRPPSHLLRSVDTQASLNVPRPVSHLTTSSTGDTLYFDAPSGPSTMSTRSANEYNRSLSPPRPTSMPPLPPRAIVTPDAAGPSSAPQTPQPQFDSGSERSSGFNRPALLLLDPPSGSAPGSPRFPTPPPMPGQLPREDTRTEARLDPADILDTPVPPRAAVSPFSTTSTRSGPVLPPGLENLANIRSWRDSSSDMPSSATFGTHSDRDVNVDVIGSGGDILEEAPPRPMSNWTQLRAVTVADAIASQRGRRTLGQVEIEDPVEDVHSVMASLHSIPDRLSPLSPLGSGSNSRAPSRAYNSSSLGSSSSQLHGRNGSGNGTSGSSRSQLGHSNSITSDGRRRPRREPGEPALTPASSAHFHRARLSAIGGHRTPITSPQRSPAADATFAQSSGMNEGTGALIGRTT